MRPALTPHWLTEELIINFGALFQYQSLTTGCMLACETEVDYLRQGQLAGGCQTGQRSIGLNIYIDSSTRIILY